MMMGGAWGRLFMLLMLVGIAGASINLAVFLVACGAIVTIGLIVYKGLYQGRYLPRFDHGCSRSTYQQGLARKGL